MTPYAAQILHISVLCDTDHAYKLFGSDGVTITSEKAKSRF